MQTILADADGAITILLIREDGEPFTPDNSQVDWELRGHAGEILIPRTSQTGVTDTALQVLITSNHNGLSDGRALEKRTLTVFATLDGVPISIREPYRITPFLNMTASAADVRGFIGATGGELNDSDLDLVSAYFDVAEIVTIEALNTALAGSEKVERSANKAIVAQAVLNVLPSLQTRITKSETDGASKIERFDIDLKDLETRARQQLGKAIEGITGTSRQTTERTLVSLTQRTDPLTGE